jgi:hypothetical protein
MLQTHILQQFQTFNLEKVNRKNTVNINQELIFAILHGYWEDKEILDLLVQYKPIKYSTVRYNMRKLLNKFNVTTRGELYRKLLKLDFASIMLDQQKIQQQLDI